jgi:shikimate dehydrogenase
VTPTARTRVFALLGDPVSHSLSPRIQNAALRAADLDGVYVALRASADDLAGLLVALARAGGGGNVTVPHKPLAARTVERRTATVDATGACNTFWLEDGRVCGDNTDVEGVSAAVRTLLGRSAKGARVLVLGAGGSARAVVHALATDGADGIVILNRTVQRAEELARLGGAGKTVVSTAASVDAVRGERFDLVVNTTSLGLRADDPLPLSPEAGVSFDAALDLVYSVDGTPWVHALRRRGVPAADGTEVLLRQGAAAFRRWWGVDAPVDAMRDALTPTERTEAR